MDMASDSEKIRFSSHPLWIPDGEYQAKCKDYSKPINYRGTRKIFLTFVLLNEPYAGKELFMAFNVGFDDIRSGSRYFKYWCAANGDKLPSPNAIMSQRIFKNKYFNVTTRTVKPKRGTEEMPFDFYYSIVDHIKLSNLPDIKEDEESYSL